MPQDADHQALIELIKRQDGSVHEGQPEQVAGRWIENGFEDPEEVERWLAKGITSPEDARREVGLDDESAERHDEPTDLVRDVARGTDQSRSRPGDPTERDPQQPGSPPSTGA